MWPLLFTSPIVDLITWLTRGHPLPWPEVMSPLTTGQWPVMWLIWCHRIWFIHISFFPHRSKGLLPAHCLDPMTCGLFVKLTTFGAILRGRGEPQLLLRHLSARPTYNQVLLRQNQVHLRQNQVHLTQTKSISDKPSQSLTKPSSYDEVKSNWNKT